ncbi:hypothetical protein [Rhodococcus globerulus]|uniref:hypothetical protein n=1 Tax=Rhodococcus globerulus TaxID=33008 RepID=UPI003017E391
MDFVSFVESADSDGVFRGFERPANPPQYQEIPVAMLRVAVARRLDLPLFAELLHDLEADDHGEAILYNSQVDMEMYRANVRKPPMFEEWCPEGKEEFLRVIDELAAVSAVDLRMSGRYIWNDALDPGTLEPLTAYRSVRTAPRSEDLRVVVRATNNPVW